MLLIQTLVFFICVIKRSKEEESNNDEVKRILRQYEQLAEESRVYVTSNYDVPFGRPQRVKRNYDFIIIGSGSAGSVLANRLSEIHKWNVLLLEIGEEPVIFTDVPAIAPVFQFTNYNWGYLMEKQDNFSLGMTDQRMHWPRGKALGGTTIINNMIYTRGNKLDYDRWAALGNPGWSYNEVLPYFLRSEDSHLQVQNQAYHNRGGYLSVRDVPYRTKSVDAFLESANQLGYNYVDYNGENQLGVSNIQATARYGARCSVEKAFLRPVRHRPNLTILTRSRVTRILIDPDTRRAYGVEYVRNRRHLIANASKEVILSAGSFNSPQLLILSGIGPKKLLQELKIPIMQSLPVGQKLYDHISFIGLSFTVNQPIVLPQSLDDPQNFVQFFIRGNGPLSSLIGIEALAFLKTNISKYQEDYPDIELIFISTDFQLDRGLVLRRMFRINDETYNRIWKPLEGQYVFTIFPTLLHPKSYGYLDLKSKNPFHWPRLYGNFLTDPENQDLKTLIAGIREAQRIVAASPFQKYNAQLVKTPIPGCEKHNFDSDPYWECALRYLTSTIHHPIATCKMGPSNDSESVVDSKLRVYGIKRLRVVDASVIPITLSGHTNTPTIMIGEKAADLIKEEWLKSEASIIDPKYIRRNAS